MAQIVLFFHVIIAFAIIGLVLIQHGKGAEAGAAFGGNAANTVFGSQGSGSFLSKATTILAITFAITSVSLTAIASKSKSAQSSNIGEQIKQLELQEELDSLLTKAGDIVEDAKTELENSDLPEIPQDLENNS